MKHSIDSYIIMGLILFGFTALLSTPAFAQSAPTFGILGDSLSDEYQADDNRGGSYNSVTFIWNEIMVKNRGINFGPWGCRGEPRRCGYEYNWARSGATTASLLSTGQHTGLAAQIAAGKVKNVIVEIGVNDFYPVYESITSGTLTGSQLTSFINNMIGNINTALNTITQAGNVNVLLVGLMKSDAFFSTQLPDPVQRQRAISATTQFNNSLAQLAQNNQVAYWDITEHFDFMFSNLINDTYHSVGGVNINVKVRGDEPTHFLLSDAPWVHQGTVTMGILANYLIREFNSHYNLGIVPLSDTEILQNAGLTPASSPTNNPTPSPTPSGAPSGTLKPGDANGDGLVNRADLVIWIGNYAKLLSGQSNADFNNNGKVNSLDFGIWRNNF